MHRKIPLLLTLILLSLSLAAAGEWNFDSSSVTYGNTLQINDNTGTPTIKCEKDASGPSCLETGAFSDIAGSFSLQGCEGSYPLRKDSEDSDFVYYLTQAEIPQRITCGYGSHEIQIYENSGDEQVYVSGGSVSVESTTANPHRGKGIRAAANINKDTLTSFFLTDECDFYTCEDDLGNERLEIKVVERDADLSDGDDDDVLTGGVIAPTENTENFAKSGEALAQFTSQQYTKEDAEQTCYFDGSKSSGDACDVLLQVFTDMGLDLDDPSNSNQIDTTIYSPLHNGGGYKLDGEIARGRVPTHYGEFGSKNTKSGDLYFFVCREGARMNDMHGNFTEQVVNVSQGPELYKCDTASGEWERTYECEDGLDNDGDGLIDESKDCDDTGTDNDESSTYSNCGPAVKKNSSGYFAIWTESGNCVSQKLTDYSNSQEEPDTFLCSPTSSYTDQGRNDLCNKAYDGSGTVHGTNMPAVEYYPNREYIIYEGEQNLDDGSVDNGDTWSSIFVSDGGFHSKYQTLHMAETLYDDGDSTTCASCHDNDTWAAKGMQNTSVNYENANDDFNNSWVVAAPEENPRGDSEAANTAKSFKGGFAGNCTSNYIWTSGNSGWTCGLGSGQATINVQFFSTEGRLNESYAGFRIPSSEIEKWGDAYSGGVDGGSNWNNLQVEAQCFLGKNGIERPDQSSEAVNITATMQTGQTNYVVGKIPDRDFSTATDTDKISRTDYTCIFGFVQKNSNLQVYRTEGRPDFGNVDITVNTASVDTSLSNRASSTGMTLWENFDSKPPEEDNDYRDHPGIIYTKNN